MLAQINLILLRELLGARLVHLRPPHDRSRQLQAWRGYVDGVDATLVATLLKTISVHGITQMFVDGSNYGAAIAAVKRSAPHVRIITFFHNVEARFFWGSLRERRSAKALAVLIANYAAERKAVRYSDILVTLSDRDSEGLRRLYGRSADVIAPMVLEDKASSRPVAPPPGQPYLLFVGGGFYANIAGIRWFVRHVAPRIELPVKVVGRGMDDLASEFMASGNATLVGAVDDLAPWYSGATLVIAPIFDGSGMKTKVAEALMYGKHVVGTPEAFSGYAADVVIANRCCADADSFVTAINDAVITIPPVWDPEMRSLYERDHSPDAARSIRRAILGIGNLSS